MYRTSFLVTGILLVCYWSKSVIVMKQAKDKSPASTSLRCRDWSCLARISKPRCTWNWRQSKHEFYIYKLWMLLDPFQMGRHGRSLCWREAGLRHVALFLSSLFVQHRISESLLRAQKSSSSIMQRRRSGFLLWRCSVTNWRWRNIWQACVADSTSG